LPSTRRRNSSRAGHCQRDACLLRRYRVLIEKYISASTLDVRCSGTGTQHRASPSSATSSLQRRHQQVIEEAPAPGLDAQARGHLRGGCKEGGASGRLCRAGTIGFIADASESSCGSNLVHGDEYHLPVEHPFTKRCTGQIWLNAAESGRRRAAPLSRRISSSPAGRLRHVSMLGENRRLVFRPSTGPLRHLSTATWVRVDGRDQGSRSSILRSDDREADLMPHSRQPRPAAEVVAQVDIWPLHSNAAYPFPFPGRRRP